MLRRRDDAWRNDWTVSWHKTPQKKYSRHHVMEGFSDCSGEKQNDAFAMIRWFAGGAFVWWGHTRRPRALTVGHMFCQFLSRSLARPRLSMCRLPNIPLEMPLECPSVEPWKTKQRCARGVGCILICFNNDVSCMILRNLYVPESNISAAFGSDLDRAASSRGAVPAGDHPCGASAARRTSQGLS